MQKNITTYEIFKTQDIETIKKGQLNFSELNLASMLDKLYSEDIAINLDFFQFLINSGIDINKQEEDGFTPLMIAIYYGDLNTVMMLVQNKADLNIVAFSDETALILSLNYYTETKNFQITEYLMDHGADFNFINKSGLSIFAVVSMLVVMLSDTDTKMKQYVKKISSSDFEHVQENVKISKEDALELIEYFLKKGANPNAVVDIDGVMGSLLMMGSIETAELLLQYGANPNAEIDNQRIMTVLFMQGNVEAVKLLLEYKADLNFTINKNHNLLFLLLSSKQLFKLYLPDSELDVLFEDFSKHKFEIAKLFIEYGVNADNVLQDAIRGYLNNKKRSLTNIENSDFSIKDKIKFTFAESNSFNVNLDTIKFLLENGANINIEYEEPLLNPLCQAIQKEKMQLVEILVPYVDDVNLYVNHNKTKTLFFEALKYSNYAIIEILIKHGANIHENSLYITPLFYAIYKNDMKLIQILVNNGANVNQNVTVLSHFTMSPLLYAVRFNYVDISKFLIENGASIDERFIFNEEEFVTLPLSAYEIADEHDDQELAIFLELKGADTTLPDEREKDDFDFFENCCQTLDVFNSLFKKPENITAVDKEKFLEDNEELKNYVTALDKEFNALEEETFSMYQSFLSIEIKDTIESKSMEKLQKLVDAGFDFSRLNINDLFLENYPHQFIYQVIKQSQNIDKQTEDGTTPLMFASEANNIELVKLLLDKGVERNIKNSAGKRAKDLATNQGVRTLIVTHTKPINNPQKLVKLLTNFTDNTSPLKGTTHEENTRELVEKYENFEGFLSAVKTQFDSIKNELESLSPNLYKKVYTFLLETNPDESYSWCSKAHINIGWSSLKGLKEWFDSGRNPFDFKLSQPVIIPPRSQLSYFRDIIELFKNEIAVRSGYNNIAIDAKYNFTKRDFYTDTEKLNDALKRIFDEINRRKTQYPDIELTTQEISEDSTIEIKITQIDSLSSRSSDELLQRAQQSGDLSDIVQNLKNLCDYSIEASYEKENFRVNFLHSNNVKDTEILNEKPKGFTHILRFYKSILHNRPIKKQVGVLLP